MEQEKNISMEEEKLNQTEQLEQSDQPEQEVSNQGLLTDAYTGVTPIIASEDQREAVQGEEGIRIQYGFYADEIKTALKIFQREMLYKKYAIYSLILGVIFLIYLVSTINSQGSKFNLFMTVISLTVLLFIWYFPLNHIRQIVKTVSQMEYKEEFILTVYNSGIDVGEDEKSILYLYQEAPIRIWETDELFIIGYDKVRVFVIPKRCCEGKEALISEKLKNGAGEKYKRLAENKKESGSKQ